MAVMNSIEVWAAAGGDRVSGLRWRDAVTQRMVHSARYEPYEALVEAAAVELGLSDRATQRLWRSWRVMEAWPDAVAIRELDVPFGFLTNCSTAMAEIAVSRSGLRPSFVLSAEQVGWFKPDGRAYLTAVTRLGVAPDSVLFVAGAPYDADGARAAGLRSVLVRRRVDQEPPGPDVRIVPSLREAVDAAADMHARLD